VASILEARKRQFGSENEWYSFKIPEYLQLRDLDPITQSAGQVHYITKAVNKGMAAVEESKKLVVQYEEFCQDPQQVFGQLLGKLNLIKSNYSGPEQFKVTRADKLPNRVVIENALAGFAGQ
jgi:hypothetical protein